MRTRDYLCLFRSKFDVMLKLSDIGLREINQAFFDFLEEREPTFTDAQAQALWWAWSLEFQSQEKQAKDFSVKQSEKGKRGGIRSASLRQANQATASFASNIQASNNVASNFQAESSKSSLTDTETDTDTDTVESNNSSHADDSASDFEPPTPTLNQIIDAGKMPDINLSKDECVKCFYYYEARDWRDAKGRRLKWLPLLRKWSGSKHEFVLSGTAKESKEQISLEDFRKAYRVSNYDDFNADFCPDMQHHRAVLSADLETLKTKYKDDYDYIIADWTRDFSRLKKAVKEGRDRI